MYAAVLFINYSKITTDNVNHIHDDDDEVTLFNLFFDCIVIFIHKYEIKIIFQTYGGNIYTEDV